MSTGTRDVPRRLVPRWRSKRDSASSGELTTNPRAPKNVELLGNAFLEEKLALWNAQKDRDSAIELASAAILLDQRALASAAGEYVERQNDATPAERNLARAVLSRPDVVDPRGLVETIDPQLEWHASIHAIRSLIKTCPRNPFLWSELSRAHTSVGNIHRAKDAMTVAAQLAPHNRYIVRAATRLFIHFGKPDIAHAILLRYEGLRHDPWVLSAEIAASGVLERTSKYIAVAKDLVKTARHSPFQLSELNGSLASVEFLAGDGRASRRHFQSSLIQPTDNAVAQAVWASNHGQPLQIPPQALEVPNAFEANTLKYQALQRWDAALENCNDWLIDEPYSRRAAELGSYIAVVAQGDYAQSEAFSRRGLLANPDSLMLRNNLAVALALQDKLEDAQAEFSVLMRHGLGDAVTFNATRGLLLYRQGDFLAGREAYLHAMELARDSKDGRSWALAGTHILLEESRTDPKAAAALLPTIEKLVSQAKDPQVTLMFDRVRHGMMKNEV
ncbi:MAG TPA: hypothetical protein VFA75_21440 [Nevskia sp.]|nr:hypothetical protein [Nevskia sp.]